MNIFDVLSLVCGLALFLFGMNYMGDTLKRSAGTQLKQFLGSMTANPFRGFLLGCGVTAVVQSSSATTVMTVGFVNSGTMTLRQAIAVIMGANVGTCITSWLTGLSGLGGSGAVDSILVWFKPTSFTPILALIGVLLYMLAKSDKRKSTGMILLGFSVLMVGMNMMADAVSPLRESEAFKNILLLFGNPILGVLVGAIMTAVLQSSSAAVGILQSLTVTGAITFGNAIPIILGQNIGTCVTAMISAIGASKNAKRTAYVHLYFNVIGTVFCLGLFYLLHFIIHFDFLKESLGMWGIAIVHTLFNLISVALLFPFRRFLEILVCRTVREKNEEAKGSIAVLDLRLLATPSVAIARSGIAVEKMAEASQNVFLHAVSLLHDFQEEGIAQVEELESAVDQYEDMIGSYLVNLSSASILEEEGRQITKQLHVIGDLERISDHAVNIAQSAQELAEKGIRFSDTAQREIDVMIDAVSEMVCLTFGAFFQNRMEEALMVEPLEQVVDDLRDKIRYHHVLRLQRNECAIEHGFVLSDLLTDLERIADHCSNIAGCMIELETFKSLEMHQYTRQATKDKNYEVNFEKWSAKYRID